MTRRLPRTHREEAGGRPIAPRFAAAALLTCLSVPFASTGCAFDEGSGFATLESARLRARFEPEAARTLDTGVLTDLGYVVELQALELTLSQAHLDELSGASDESFDPASPPAGYSLCHGGHCHSDDGALVSYEDIENELLGGTSSFTKVAVFDLDEGVDVLGGRWLPLGSPQPSSELPMTHLRRFVLEAASIRLGAVIREGDLPAGEEAEIDMDVTGPFHFSVSLDTAIDRDGPARLHLDLRLTYTARLFDGIDFAKQDDVGEADSPTLVSQLLEGLSNPDLELSL